MNDNEIYPQITRSPHIKAGNPKEKKSLVGLEVVKHSLPKIQPKEKIVGKRENHGLVVGTLRDGVRDLLKVLSKIKTSGKWGLTISKKEEYVLTELLPRDAYRPMSAERLNLAVELYSYAAAKGSSLVNTKDTDEEFIQKVALFKAHDRSLCISFSWQEYDSDTVLQWVVDFFIQVLQRCGQPVYLRTEGSRLCFWEVCINQYAIKN